MKISKKLTAAISAFGLCSLYLPVTAYAEYKTEFIPVPVQDEENGVITDKYGDEWYKVSSFDDDKKYIISVKNNDDENVLLTAGSEKNQEYIWRFYRRVMVTSSAPEYMVLATSSFCLNPDEDGLSARVPAADETDKSWEHCGSVLRYDHDGDYSYLKYDEASETPFSMTDDISEAAQVDIYTNGESLERCIKTHPCAESYVIEGSGYAAPEFSVELSNEDITTDKVTWFVDENEYPCDTLMFTAEELADQPTGIHRVSCLVEAHDSNNVHYREKSANALFVVAKGVVPDSAISFSDVHEEYDLIGDAVGNVMERTGGFIPSLIICTGDLVNGPTPDSDKMLKRYYPQIVPQFGGIDAVFVSGNHDPGEAASVMSEKAALSSDGSITAKGGLIFDGSSDAVLNGGKSSQYGKDIKVYSINYDSEIFRNDGQILYSYKDIIGGLDEFLKATAEDYHGELVIISAHSGLHVLGEINSGGRNVSSWAGENMYNVDDSYELASLINSYAEKYNMNIMYLFGHDHSRLEEELIMTKGDTLKSTVSYSDKSYGELTLNFTYAHAGYLSTVIGCADKQFSFIYKNGDDYGFDLIHLSDNSVKHTDISSLYHAEQPETTTTETTVTVSSAVTSTETTTVSSSAASSNQTSSTNSSSAPQTTKTSISTTISELLPDTGIKTVAVPLAVIGALSMINFGCVMMRKTKK